MSDLFKVMDKYEAKQLDKEYTCLNIISTYSAIFTGLNLLTCSQFILETATEGTPNSSNKMERFSYKGELV